MPLSTGTRLGPYEIVAPLGAGGMGEVYLARDTKLGRPVALKVLPEAFAHDAERMARFEREAQVLASLNHPNIATIHGLEEANGIRALVMELVEGPTLAERIGGRAMVLEESLPIAKQIADGLEYAHEKGIVHRDLKPANVKLTADGNVKLLDFGLAKALEGAPIPAGNPSTSPTLTMEGTRAGVILGTAAYMSPEQVRGAVVDKRADIWAYGAVLYEMLTGKQPFAEATVSDTLVAVLTKEPDLNAIPARMQRLVRNCLEKDVKQRLRDIGDVRIAMNDTSSPEIVPRAPKRVLPWAVAGVLALALAVAFWAPWRATRPVSLPLMRLRVELGPDAALTGYGAGEILSPDGTRVVYTGYGTDGTWRLYTRQLDQDHPAPLVGTEGAGNPFFSPDGQFLGFFAGGKLKKISVLGGGAVVLCDSPAGRGGSWGEDGNIIAALNAHGGLSRVSSGGGVVQPVTELKQEKNEFTHRSPQVLLGAQVVLFTAHISSVGMDEATIEAQSLRTGERKTLVRGGYYGRYVPSGHLLYVRNGTVYAVPMNIDRLELTGPAVPVLEQVASEPSTGFAHLDFSRTGTLVYLPGESTRETLVWLDSAGHTKPLRATAAEYYEFLRFSPDGNRLAMSVVEDRGTDLWVYDWKSDKMTRLTFTPGFNSFPVWSPDGKHILFASERHRGSLNLYWMRADGAGETVRLTESKNDQRPFSFTPDGKYLAFNEIGSQTNYDLWTLPLEDVESDHPKAGKPEPFLVTPFNESRPMVSPDGRWLTYVSDESGSSEVYVRRFPGPGGKWQISTGGGSHPLWSKKAPELFYKAGERMMVASYTANGEAFVASKPRISATTDLDIFDVSPDGKRFAAVQEEQSDRRNPAQVIFLLNFFDELRRRAPSETK